MVFPSLSARNIFLYVNMLAVSATILYIFAIFSGGSNGSPSKNASHHGHFNSYLAAFALTQTLQQASPIFGLPSMNNSKTSHWMSTYPDSTPLTHLNIPGTHDSATWNYSQTTQNALKPIVALVSDPSYPPDWFRCQSRSFIDMLDDGIRAFDLRYAHDVTNSTLVFWHGPSLQSETATVGDVLIAFYSWLDSHPSEVLLLSFQYEGSTSRYSANDAGVHTLLYSELTSAAAKRYVKQDHTLGTLGDARGKIVLLRRFDLDKLPASYTAELPGLHFSPSAWTDNVPDITLVYDTATNGTAYIEDYYSPNTAVNSTAELNIRYKLNATVAHLEYAAGDAHPDDLFWTFASSTNIAHLPPITPTIQALGDGVVTPGVNQQLVPFLKTMQGKRLGIVMFDFYEEPAELLPLFLGLTPP
nr:hypothetical protein B0A51_17345 [Rachicladosporium sp. CCFEE 5018]